MNTQLTATVSFTVIAPAECSEAQFEQWIKQEIGFVPSDHNNLLFAYNLGDAPKLENVKIKILK